MADKRPSSPETNGGSELVLKKQKTETGAIVTASPKVKDVRPSLSLEDDRAKANQCLWDDWKAGSQVQSKSSSSASTDVCIYLKWLYNMQGPDRTSALLAPIMLLSGHAGEVFTAKFSPDGTVVASGSHDKHLFFWRTYGECENFMMIQGKLLMQQDDVCLTPNAQIVIW